MKIQELNFRGKSYFEDGGTKSYSEFERVYRYFKTVTNTNTVTAWKSKRLLDESIKPPSTSDNNLNLGINNTDNVKIQAKFDGSCFRQEKELLTNKW